MSKRLYLLVTSILCVALSFPGSPFPWLAWMILPLALMAVVNISPRLSALILWIWAFVWWVGAVWWLAPALHDFTQASWLVSLALLSGLCAYNALPYLLIGYFINRVDWSHGVVRCFLFAGCCAAIIVLFPTPLPASPINSQYLYPYVIQMVSLGGEFLLLWCFFLFAFGICLATQQMENSQLRRGISYFAVAVSIPVSALFLGMALIPDTEMKENGITVSYVQPNASRESTLNDVFVLMQDILAVKQSQLVIWPEIPIDLSLKNRAYDLYRITQLVKEMGAPLLVVSSYEYIDAEQKAYFSTAHFMRSDAESETYSKQVLVPFFEYLPLADFLPAIRKLFPQALNYKSGAKFDPSKSDHKSTESNSAFHLIDDVNLLPFICYELIFADIVRGRMDLTGKRIIVNPSNDGWFGLSKGAQSHLALALFRAVENRTPIVRVSNSGVSLMIDEYGRILPASVIRVGEPGYRTAKIFPASDMSIYQRGGYLLPYLLIALFILQHLLIRRRDKR